MTQDMVASGSLRLTEAGWQVHPEVPAGFRFASLCTCQSAFRAACEQLEEDSQNEEIESVPESIQQFQQLRKLHVSPRGPSKTGHPCLQASSIPFLVQERAQEEADAKAPRHCLGGATAV